MSRYLQHSDPHVHASRGPQQSYPTNNLRHPFASYSNQAHVVMDSSSAHQLGDLSDSQEDLDSYYLQSEEHVVALHDFTSNNATCLTFRAGQVIKVYNRDPSGWWDGELDGYRGWFPSNYVDQDAVYVAEADAQHSLSGSVESSNAAHSDSGSNIEASFVSTSQRETYYSAHTSRPSTPLSRSLSDVGQAGILDPTLHALSLLRTAAQAKELSRYQTSTACIISSVRSVLSATDCLTRESSVLVANPNLARERKAILSELSKLVAQARKASAPMSDEELRLTETDSMLFLADQVFRNVLQFIDVAAQCGVPVPDQRSSTYDDFYLDPNAHSSSDRMQYSSTEIDKTPTPNSSHSSFAGRRAEPSAQLSAPYAAFRENSLPVQRPHYQHRHPSDGSFDSDSASDAIARARHLTHNKLVAGNGSRSSSGSSYLVNSNCVMARTRSDSSYESPESVSGFETGSHTGSFGSTEDDGFPSFEDRSPEQVMHRLSITNDQLLSIIAAFIGHVHSHTSESHASSYARLIDMTREAVVGVRNVLLVVEAVNNNPLLQQQRPRETTILWETRESLYEATTQLVTAARIVTSAPSAAIAAGSAAEAEDKSRLLQAATSVLRTGGECVGAVRLCIDRLESTFVIELPKPARTYRSRASSRATNPETEADQQEEESADPYGSQSGRPVPQRKNTLSFLGRKATSLTYLKQKYEPDGRNIANIVSIDENEFSPDETEMTTPNGLRRDRELPNTENDSTIKVQQGPSQKKDVAKQAQPSVSRPRAMTTQGGSSQDSQYNPSSLGASFGAIFQRNTSRASRSASVSLRAEVTGETSARNSLEQNRPSAYRESRGPAVSVESRYMAPDYDPSDVICNAEGQVTGVSLQALVEKMTLHDSMAEPTLSNAFFLCFRVFSSPLELFKALMARFDMPPPANVFMSEADTARWTDVKVIPVRLRVLNLFKSWLENHWNPATDHVILLRLVAFAARSAFGALAIPAQRLGELARTRLESGTTKTTVLVGSLRGPGSLQRVISSEKVKLTQGLTMTDASQMYAPSAFFKGGALPPTSIVTKTLLSNLRSDNREKITILDFDPLELARQLTIMDSKQYCAIQSEELLGAKFSKETKEAGTIEDVHVKSMSSTSTRITGWISECILGESDARKRSQLLKFFIKLGDKCEQLNNFHTLMAIQCALNSSTIARLKKTWDGLSTKHRSMMDHQRRVLEHTRNYAGYRARLRSTAPPAVPFLGLFLTDLTFCHEGNAANRPCPSDPERKLLNFDKYVKTSRIVGEVQRFQVPYNLVEVPEIQRFLTAALSGVQSGNGGHGADDLYRRSLMLEPRAGSKPGTNSAINQGSISASTAGSLGGSLALRQSTADNGKLGGLDIFNWRTDKA